jgi:molecular chaperone HscB
MDPFSALGLPRRYAIDLAAAERTHRELARALHPDRYAGAGASERRAALARAADVNEAWRVLRDPVRRAEALFALAGVPVGEDREPAASPELLAEVLELREALSEARAAKDAARVRALAAEVEEKAKRTESALGAALDAGKDLASHVALLGELRFYRRFLEEVSLLEDEMEG